MKDMRTTVIVGVDDTHAGTAALQCALAEARQRNARLVAVHTWTLAEANGSRRRRRRPMKHGLQAVGFIAVLCPRL